MVLELIAAVLIIGLGCERNQLSGLMAQEGLAAGERLRTFVMQRSVPHVQRAVIPVELLLRQLHPLGDFLLRIHRIAREGIIVEIVERVFGA